MMPTALLRDAFVVVAVAAVLSSAAHQPSSRLSAIRQLKAELHTLTAEEAAQRFRQLGDTHRLTSPPPRQRKIDHFVVLYQENRGFDHIYGCMDLPGADGIIGHKIPLLPEHPKLGHVNVTCGTAPYVCKGGPGFSTFSGHFRKGTNAKKYPYATQDDAFSYQNGGHGVAIEMFSPEQLPVKRALAKEYGVFNKLYTATPTASTPNHHFTQSATSCGSTNNNDYTDCGGKTLLFPQMTMYDTMWMDNVSFRFYMNSTCNTREGRPCNSVGPHKDTSPVYAPDASLAGVARYTDHFYSHTQFYQDAASGELPAFSWLNAKEEACDHPCHDIAKGERALKDIYEALRAGPKWNTTLFVNVYDDAGGTYDHVVPPFEGVPDDEAPCQAPCRSFDFRRLGLRSAAIAMSPWITKGRVIQEPQAPFGAPGRSPFNTSQFELTSIAASVKHLFNLSTFLTKRDAWSGNFEELLLDAPRPESDMPIHLPDAPQPSTPWTAAPDPLPAPYDKQEICETCRDPATAPREVCTRYCRAPHTFAQCNCSQFCESPAACGELADGAAAAAAAAAASSGGRGGRRRLLRDGSGRPAPEHCGRQEQTCRGLGVVNVRQRRFIKLYSRLTLTPEPNYERMSFHDGEVWLAQRWQEWMDAGAPVR